MRLADVELVDVPVSPQRRVGRQGRGFAHISEVLTFERAVVACLATEFAKVVLEDLGSYLMDHQIFGAPLSEHGYHRLRLGEWWAEYRVLSAATRSMLAGFAADNVSWREVFSLKLMSSIFIRKLAVEVQHLGGAASWVAGGRWAGLADDVRWLCLAGGASEVLQARLASDALKQTKTAATR